MYCGTIETISIIISLIYTAYETNYLLQLLTLQFGVVGAMMSSTMKCGSDTQSPLFIIIIIIVITVFAANCRS